jgi:hypothetical protein
MHAARGLTSADIGLKLDFAERTVEFHFAGIRSKLSAVNRQAIAKAMASGLIDPWVRAKVSLRIVLDGHRTLANIIVTTCCRS